MLGGCPLFGGCPDSEISHGRSMSLGFGECPKDFKCKKKNFVLKINFHTWQVACVRESVRIRGIDGACRHLSRIMHLLECVWLPLHVHLGGE